MHAKTAFLSNYNLAYKIFGALSVITFLIKSEDCFFFQSMICKYIAKVHILDYKQNHSIIN